MTVDRSHTDALLCVADTKLVLGNVCSAVVFNGRSIADFATILAIAGTSLGAARALYRVLENYGFDYVWLERGRGKDELAVMDLLDEPPHCWSDFVVTLYLAEAAATAFISGLTGKVDRKVDTQVGCLLRDSAFHARYCLGWVTVLAKEERDDLARAIERRVPLAQRWLSCAGDAEKQAFGETLDKLTNAASLTVSVAALPRPEGWDTGRKRAGQIPPSLWEIVRFKDAELVS